jgi:hypothetical protein
LKGGPNDWAKRMVNNPSSQSQTFFCSRRKTFPKRAASHLEAYCYCGTTVDLRPFSAAPACAFRPSGRKTAFADRVSRDEHCAVRPEFGLAELG